MPETHHRSGSRTVAALLAFLTSLTSLTVVSLTTAAPADAAAIKTARAFYARAIEPLAGYQPQTTCSPRAKPGVANFAARLLAAYPHSHSLGIARACSAAGRSEHKEGRAFDWGVSAKTVSGRHQAHRLLHWLLKKDKYGNRYAMARRLGIQYLIWNHRIWGSYAASRGWRKYTGSNPHTDHVHISFTWAGARARTSFWTGKVGHVGAAPAPTLPPGPPVPDPDGEQHPPPPGTGPLRPEPAPAAVLPPGQELVDETITVPAAADGAITIGALTAGQDYLLEASGSYRWGTRAGQWADAECSRAPGDSTWRRDRSVHPAEPWSDHLDLYVDGTDLQARPDVDTGDDCDTRTHTYRWTYQPSRTGRVAFALWDPTTAEDNSGAVTVRVIALRTPDEMSWQVPATAAAGVTSPGALEAGGTYLVTVSGTVSAGGGVVSDAECSATSTDPQWRRDRSVLADQPGADHLDVYVDGDDVSLSPDTDPDGDGCDTDGHTYRLTLQPDSTRALNLRVDDPAPGDDSGTLAVSVVRVRPPVGSETVNVDTAGADEQTGRTYLAGQPLRITATGSYTFASGVTADAECSATTADPTWRSSRSTLVAEGRYLGDITIGGALPDWTTATGSRCDPTTHAYGLTYTPTETGPLTFGVADLDRSDNLGVVTVTVAPMQ